MAYRCVGLSRPSVIEVKIDRSHTYSETKLLSPPANSDGTEKELQNTMPTIIFLFSL
jgi:hypothetical protein